MTINERVLALDLNNLSQADFDWLHELKTKAQAITTAMYYKSEGIDRMRTHEEPTCAL